MSKSRYDLFCFTLISVVFNLLRRTEFAFGSYSDQQPKHGHTNTYHARYCSACDLSMCSSLLRQALGKRRPLPQRDEPPQRAPHCAAVFSSQPWAERWEFIESWDAEGWERGEYTCANTTLSVCVWKLPMTRLRSRNASTNPHGTPY